MILLRFKRQERGISQTRLAEMLDFTREHISRVENHPPELHRVSRRLRRGLERIFDEPVEKLLSPVRLKDE